MSSKNSKRQWWLIEWLFGSETKPACRSRSARPCLEGLEVRLTPAIPTHSPGNDSYEVYAWALINEMRDNPAVFGDTIVKLHNKEIAQAYGLPASDPVWDDLRDVVKYFDGRKMDDGSIWRFSEWATFIKSQNYQLGPLALQNDLSSGAYTHTTWMTTHGYGHSISKDDPASKASVSTSRPEGFSLPGVNNDPDRVILGAAYDGAWGENINTQANALEHTYQARRNGTFGDAGFYQRVVFYDVMTYIIDCGNGAYTDASGRYHAAYGHLLNLLADDRNTGPSLGLTSQGPKNKEISRLNAIGLDFYFYQTGDGNANDGIAHAWASTHRLARSKTFFGEGGGYIVAFNYTDANGDGFYTPGINEGPRLTYDYSYTVGNLGSSGSVAFAAGTNNGLETIGYFPATTVDISLTANGQNLGDQQVAVNGRNVLVKKPISKNLRLLESSTPTLAGDLAEPNAIRAAAFGLGTFDANQVRGPAGGVFTIHTSSDRDWYRFDVVGGNAQTDLQIGFQHSQGDIEAKLYRVNASGGLDTMKSMTSSDNDERYKGQLTAGTYYIEVYGYSGATNFYNLSLDVTFVRPADTAGGTMASAAATGLRGDSGTFTVSSSLDADDVDLFAIDVNAGARIQVTTDPSGGRVTDTRLRLFDAAGRALVTGDDRPGSSYSALSFVAQATARYYIGVSGFDNVVYNASSGASSRSGQQGEYRLTISLGPNTPPPTNLPVIASAFAHSREHYADFVTKAYAQYLKRTPDSAGLNGWVDAMQYRGLTDERLEAGFIGSAEYIANHGGSGRGWVIGLYNDLLGRAPGQAEVDAWVAALDRGISPATVAFGFGASAERAAIRVRENYSIFLGRSASSEEVAGWVSAFGGGLTNEAMVAGFVGSAEYYARTGKGSGIAADWIRSAYLDVLFRQAGDAEVNGWLGVIR